MAEGGDDQERSEDPTQKRLDDAVKKGDVAKSQEVNTWFLLAGGTFALYSFGGFTAERLARAFTQIFSQAHAFGTAGSEIGQEHCDLAVHIRTFRVLRAMVH